MPESERKIAVLGGSGMVGVPVVKHLGRERVDTPPHQDVDLTNVESIIRYLDKHPEITTLINFAAYTDVSAAQKNPEETNKCLQINVGGVENLIKALENRKDIFLIHISTDMVFPGTEDFPGPYTEKMIPPDDPGRLTKYGDSKRRGELIVKNHPNVAIIRIIYPVTTEGKLDYLRAPLDYFEKHHELYSIFRNQQMNMALVAKIAETIAVLIKNKKVGIYNVSASDTTTPLEIMRRLFRVVYGTDQMVEEGILSPSVRYPMYGGLDSSWTRSVLGVYYPTNMETVDILHGRE